MVTRLDVVALLDSLAPLYPGGVPRVEQKSAPTPEKAGSTAVAVYGVHAASLIVLGLSAPAPTNPFLDGAAGELLIAALTKGLKIDLAAVAFVAVAAGTDPAPVVAVLQSLGGRVGLAFGEGVVPYLGNGAPVEGWLTHRAVRWRVAPTPHAVVADSRLKRALWLDLQAIGVELEGATSRDNGGGE
jgi:hypothetical protein